MIPNPIHKVLSTFQSCGVRALLMGGQACVFYGGAQFSRNTDFAILADEGNLLKLSAAMKHLQAQVIAVPSFDPAFLEKGHAIHFRCQHPDCQGMRVDVMSKMRGVSAFVELWERRTVLQGSDGTLYDIMSLPDLVAAKKTQRDKDWPMIRRLIEADHAASPEPTNAQIQFWLKEGRSPPLLLSLAASHPTIALQISQNRPAISAALQADESATEAALRIEEDAERHADRAYWAPLKRELEALRHARQ